MEFYDGQTVRMPPPPPPATSPWPQAGCWAHVGFTQCHNDHLGMAEPMQILTLGIVYLWVYNFILFSTKVYWRDLLGRTVQLLYILSF